MLQIGVEQNEPVALRDARPGQERLGLAQIPVVVLQLEAAEPFPLTPSDLERIVYGPVVDEDDLAVQAVLAEGGIELAEQLRDVGALVERRDDNGEVPSQGGVDLKIWGRLLALISRLAHTRLRIRAERMPS